MKKMIWIIVCAVILTAAVLCAAGVYQLKAGKDPSGTDGGGDGIPQGPASTAGLSQRLPEGTAFVALKYQQTGTAMFPWLSIRPAGDGFLCEMSHGEPLWAEMDGDKADPVSDGDPGVFSSIVPDPADVLELFKKLDEAGVYGWKGYSGYKPLPAGLLDGDNGFRMKLLLSDGSVIEAQGSNAYPEEYEIVRKLIYDFFEAHREGK